MATKEELKQQFIVLVKKAEKKYKEHMKIGQTPKICIDQNLKHLSPKESVEYIKQILILFHCDINKSISFFKSNYGYFNNIDRIFKAGAKIFKKKPKQPSATSTKATKSNKNITSLEQQQQPTTLNNATTTTTSTQSLLQTKISQQQHLKTTNELESNNDTTPTTTRVRVAKTKVNTTTQPSTLTRLNKKLN